MVICPARVEAKPIRIEVAIHQGIDTHGSLPDNAMRVWIG